MIKMNKLALCALLFSGLLSAVRGDEAVDQWLEMNKVQLFNALGNPKGCEEAFERVKADLAKEGDRKKVCKLSGLIQRVDSLCTFWEWFATAELEEGDIKRIFSEAVSSSQDLEDARELVFLRDTGWGEKVRGDDSERDGKFKVLESLCKDFI